MTLPRSLKSTVRGILQLALGTALIRLVTGMAQFIFAIWLTPTEFGYWAAAISSSAVAVALTNLGMVDGYLARRGLTFAKLIRDTVIGNSLLAASLGVIAVSNHLAGRSEVATLVVLAAINIPLTGMSEVLNARRLKANQYRSIVASQAWAAGAKLLIGVLLAALTGSALAIGISAIAFSLVMIIYLAGPGRNAESTIEKVAFGRKDRASWAVSALSMKLPAYVGLFVAQFLTTAEVLGIYYLSYQAVLAVSSVVAPPMKKVVLSALSQTDNQQRVALCVQLSHLASSATAVLAGGLIVVLPLLWFAVPPAWEIALLPLLIFMSQLPGRMLSPVLDAYQQAGGRWWRSIRFHAMDGVVIAIAALSAATDQVVYIALSVTIGRVLLMSARCFLEFPVGGRRKFIICFSSLALPLLLVVSASVRLNSVFPALLTLCVALSWMCRSLVSSRARTKGDKRRGTRHQR